eukprot:1158881-Pelagomonas_calceolata.AAC.5
MVMVMLIVHSNLLTPGSCLPIRGTRGRTPPAACATTIPPPTFPTIFIPPHAAHRLPNCHPVPPLVLLLHVHVCIRVYRGTFATHAAAVRVLLLVLVLLLLLQLLARDTFNHETLLSSALVLLFPTMP